MASNSPRFEGFAWLHVIGACLLLLAGHSVSAQNWKKVHRADEEKWAKATKLDPYVIHKLWVAAAPAVSEDQNDARIANLDLDGLAARGDVLLVTYAGERNCLTITVFRRLSESKFEKEWSTQQPPDGTGFCDTDFGSAAAEATDGIIAVRVPHSVTNGVLTYTVYAYDWNGVTYRFAGEKQVEAK